LANLIGPDKLVDSDEYYVIAVDALGMEFLPHHQIVNIRAIKIPSNTIKDMVNSQYKLLTEHLGKTSYME